jgi:hypothetical protein
MFQDPFGSPSFLMFSDPITVGQGPARRSESQFCIMAFEHHVVFEAFLVEQTIALLTVVRFVN